MYRLKLEEAAKRVREFESNALTGRLSKLESSFKGLTKSSSRQVCEEQNLDSNLLTAAAELKRLAGQINVVIHASGILAALPSILEEREIVENLSLGAGNTGRKFDLETNLRIAEFKFINWKGGPESIRQNSLFKDFYGLAEEDTKKMKCLYVLGTDKPLKFLKGTRKLSSVMSRNQQLARDFEKRYGSRFSVVSEYFRHRKSSVQIIDVATVLPELVDLY